MADTAPEFSGGNKWFAAALNKVIRYARGHGVNPAGVPGWSWSIDGWVPPRSTNGVNDGRYGFKVIPSGDSGVKVTPSVVSGMGAWGAIPTINGDPITDSPAPILTVAAAKWVALKMEIIPSSELYFSDSVNQYWRLAEGAGALAGDITVVGYPDVEAMEADAIPAQIDQEDGDVIENGIYVIPLSYRSDTDSNSWEQIGYTGPLGVRMCASGAFIALSPARGTIVDGV